MDDITTRTLAVIVLMATIAMCAIILFLTRKKNDYETCPKCKANVKDLENHYFYSYFDGENCGGYVMNHVKHEESNKKAGHNTQSYAKRLELPETSTPYSEREIKAVYEAHLKPEGK